MYGIAQEFLYSFFALKKKFWKWPSWNEGSCRFIRLSSTEEYFWRVFLFIPPAVFCALQAFLCVISSCEEPHPSWLLPFFFSPFLYSCVCPWVVRYRTVISSWCSRTRRRVETAGRCAPGKRKPGTTSLSKYGGRVEKKKKKKKDSCSWKSRARSHF